MIVYTKFQITIPCRWFEIAFSTEQSALKTLSKPFLLSVEISNQSSFKISTSKCALVQQCTVFANGTNLVAQSASFVASIFFTCTKNKLIQELCKTFIDMAIVAAKTALTATATTGGTVFAFAPKVVAGVIGFMKEDTRRKVSEFTVCEIENNNSTIDAHSNGHINFTFPGKSSLKKIVPSSTLWPLNILVDHKVQVLWIL